VSLNLSAAHSCPHVDRVRSVDGLISSLVRSPQGHCSVGPPAYGLRSETAMRRAETDRGLHARLETSFYRPDGAVKSGAQSGIIMLGV
jgi:hypothetical protein